MSEVQKLPDPSITPCAEPLQITSQGLLSFVDISPDALVIVNQNGLLTLVNQHAETLFGYTREELLGQPLDLLLPPRFRRAHAAHRASFFSAPRTRSMGVGLELVGLRKDGTEFPVDISLNPLLLDGVLHVIGAIRDVTAQKLLERERALQAERLVLQNTLIHQAHDAILVRDPINRVLSWNRGAEELYGWPAQEALGRVTHTLLKTRASAGLAAIEAHVLSKGQWEGELTHTCKDGSLVVVESRQVVMRDEQGAPTAVLEINRDITERKRAEQAQTAVYSETLAQRLFFQQMLDALPTSVYVVHGQDAHLVLANRAAASIWGREWQVGQPMAAFLQEHAIRIEDAQGQEFAPEAWATTRALLEGETILQHQEVIRQSSGRRVPVLVNAVPLVSSHWGSVGPTGQAAGNEPSTQEEPLALVIHQDVRVLKEAEYFKDEFIGIAAHELRQPLAVLKGTVGTLMLQTARGHGPNLASWQQELLQDLDQATDRLVQLTEDLLDVSRLQAGQVLLQRAPTDLVGLLRRLVERFQKTTTRHHLSLDTPQDRLEALVDPTRMEQILANLLTNALKYSPQGGQIEIGVEVHAESQEVEIRVRDHGIGIPLHQQGRIFGRFMRADNAQAAGIHGTGLGLYLCRALVEQHGGRLWFESREGMGSAFFLLLPLVADLPLPGSPLDAPGEEAF